MTEALLKPPENDGDPADGAVVIFGALVRGIEDRREIEGIDYEAHKAMAEHQFRLLAEGRDGEVSIEEGHGSSSGRFRGAAARHHYFFKSGRRSRSCFRGKQMDCGRAKKKVPIWKRPRFKIENLRRASQSEAATAR